MRFLRIAWNRWKLKVALEEVEDFQGDFEVGPIYLCNVMCHAADVRRVVDRLKQP